MKVTNEVVTIFPYICVQVRRRGEGGTTTTCGTVHVEEHVRCKCDCRVMKSHCNSEKQV